jgi:hypothetical protein
MRGWREMEEFDSSGEGRAPEFPGRFFPSPRWVFGRRKVSARIGNAASFVFPAQEFMDFAMPRMISVATAKLCVAEAI